MSIVGQMPEMMQNILYTTSTWPFQEGVAHFEAVAQAAATSLQITQSQGAPTVEFVIAHCKEPLDWVSNNLMPIAPAGSILTIYEKCGEQPMFPADVLAHFGHSSLMACPDPAGLPRGDECLAYLSHIVSRYDNLASFTVFLQADPDQHLHFSYLQTVLAMLARGTYKVPYMSLNGGRHVRTMSPCLNAVYESIFGESQKEPLGPYCCAQFIVQDVQVRARPLSFYRRMLGMVDGSMYTSTGHGDLCTNFPVTRSTHCYGMEFMWHRVFGDEYETPLRQDDTRLPLSLRQKFGDEFIKKQWNDMVLNPNTPKKIVSKTDYTQG